MECEMFWSGSRPCNAPTSDLSTAYFDPIAVVIQARSYRLATTTVLEYATALGSSTPQRVYLISGFDGNVDVTRYYTL